MERGGRGGKREKDREDGLERDGWKGRAGEEGGGERGSK